MLEKATLKKVAFFICADGATGRHGSLKSSFLGVRFPLGARESGNDGGVAPVRKTGSPRANVEG